MRGDGILAEQFKIIKGDAIKSTALNTPANVENSAVATELKKVNFYSNPKERQWQGKFKVALFSHASK